MLDIMININWSTEVNCSKQGYTHTGFKYHWVCSHDGNNFRIIQTNIIDQIGDISYESGYKYFDMEELRKYYSNINKCYKCKFGLLMVAKKCPTQNKFVPYV